MRPVYERALEEIDDRAEELTDDYTSPEEAFANAAHQFWSNGDPPFQFLSPTGHKQGLPEEVQREASYLYPNIDFENYSDSPLSCGCLTQVKQRNSGGTMYAAFSVYLTERIRNDPRIPTDSDNLTREDVLYMIQVQEEIDTTFPGRTPDDP